MDAPKIFLSYARADHKIAERLRTSLEKHGCIVHDPAANGRPVAPRLSVPWDDLKEAADRSDQLVLLFGKHRDRDVMQEQEWQAALEASWDDESKKMIPVLIGNAELPNFVRGAAGTGRSSMGFHVNGLREAERAAKAIAENVKAKPAASRSTVVNEPPGNYEPKRGYSLGVEDEGYAVDSDGKDDDDHGLSFTVEPPAPEEIEARFDAIERHIEELKT